MTLKELEQQIVSEAVKVFRENVDNLDDFKNRYLPMVESFWIPTLTQSMRKVAVETAKAIEEGPIGYDFSTEKAADLWLNHNSEEGKCVCCKAPVPYHDKDCPKKSNQPNQLKGERDL